jgi:hypothetical protein
MVRTCIILLFVQYDQSVLNDHYCQNRFTGGLAAVSQVTVILHFSVVIKEDFLRFCGCTLVKSLNFKSYNVGVCTFLNKQTLLLALLHLTACGNSNDLARCLTCPCFVSLLFKILSLHSPEKTGV